MRILVAEDDPEIGVFLKNNLVSQAFSVDWISDGERASYMARTNDYDLMILDNNLPGKLGSEIVHELREVGRATPIMMLTVEGGIDKKVEALDGGADDYVTKPFLFAELLARIHAILRRPVEVRGDVLRIADVELDTQRQVVQRANEVVYLTRKEFQLLEYLMRNQGRVVSRGMIMEHVWDVNADPFSNTIETHVLNLRRKIDREGDSVKIIHTVPGRGYKADVRK